LRQVGPPEKAVDFGPGVVAIVGSHGDRANQTDHGSQRDVAVIPPDLGRSPAMTFSGQKGPSTSGSVLPTQTMSPLWRGLRSKGSWCCRALPAPRPRIFPHLAHWHCRN